MMMIIRAEHNVISERDRSRQSEMNEEYEHQGRRRDCQGFQTTEAEGQTKTKVNKAEKKTTVIIEFNA